MTNSTNQTEYADEWDGVYYDANVGEIVEIVFHENGSVLLIPERENPAADLEHNNDGGVTCPIEGKIEPIYGYETVEGFQVDAEEFYRISDEVRDNPVEMAEIAYNKGFSHVMNHGPSDQADSLAYADHHVEIVDKRDQEKLKEALQTLVAIERDRLLNFREDELHTSPKDALQEAMDALGAVGVDVDQIVWEDDRKTLGLSIDHE